MASAPTKNKKGTVIHRTTSETLRLGECDLLNHNPIRVSASTNSRKKSQTTSPSCSFQITGVSLTRYDLGDDSADDLDESHTDDISRVTDNETPSFSEDSRDTDEPYQQNHNVSQQIILKPEPADNNKWQGEENSDVGLGRFKVVKIESIAPFSRGRWTCFDYLDHSDNAQISYIYCKQKFVKQENVGPLDERLKKIPNTSSFWENNCQDSYMFQGNYIIPETYLTNSMQKQKRTRNSFPTSPNLIARPARASFIHSPSLDSTIPEKNEKGHEPNINKTYALQIQVSSDTKISSQNTRASVSCTATIDTKIEHALDVVKNHLTHAVRLEVEELKVKINELVDRISYLEYENDLLRANVAPDVLANLETNGENK